MKPSGPSAERKSRWIKCISTHGNIRGVAIEATELVRTTAALHQVSGIAAKGFSEALMGALLISSYCKNGERINLNIQGNKHYKQALVDAYPDGRVRGYIVERPRESFESATVDLDMGPWGEGFISVLRTKDLEKEQPYIGTVPLLTGHLAKDLTFYWAQSEQIPSATGLAVEMTGDEVAAAGGFLIQAMPGASAAEVRMIEQHIHEIQSLAANVASDADPLHLLSQIFQSTAFVVLEEKPLVFQCNCSWERVHRALILVGADELRKMLPSEESASVRCDFCTKEYRVDLATLEAIANQKVTPA